jgi:hypothetical protein
VLRRQRDVAVIVLQDVGQPVRQFQIAVARSFGLAQRLDERLVSDPVELAGHCLERDVSHDVLVAMLRPRTRASACAAA